jgi:hypothetical protein
MRVNVTLLVILAIGGCDAGGGAEPGPAADAALEIAASADTAKPSEIVPGEALPPGPFETGISAKGYGEYCASDADCPETELSCFTNGPADLYAVCSSSCGDNLDCSEYHTCNLKLGGDHPPMICTESDFCSPCQDDIQCMLPGMRCLPDAAGQGFCSPPCVPGSPSCDAGSRCVYEAELEDFYCRPILGTCLGDGGQCSPCRYDLDCQADHLCLEMTYSKEKFCAKICAGGGEDCLPEMACVNAGPNAAPVCFPTWNEQLAYSCYVETEAFCDACIKDYNCQSGICYYSYGGADGGFCTEACVLATDCPEGMACVARYDLYDNSLAGYACAPVGEDAGSCADHLMP